MIDLRKSIQDLLMSENERVFFESAPETTTFPYVVFDLRSAWGDGECEEDISLDVTAWAIGADSYAVESLVASIDAVLNRAVINKDDWAAVIYRNGRLTLGDPDPRVRGRRYMYTIKVYKEG